MGVLTPEYKSYILVWAFPLNKPTSDKGVPPWLRKPPYGKHPAGGPRLHRQYLCGSGLSRGDLHRGKLRRIWTTKWKDGYINFQLQTWNGKWESFTDAQKMSPFFSWTNLFTKTIPCFQIFPLVFYEGSIESDVTTWGRFGIAFSKQR